MDAPLPRPKRIDALPEYTEYRDTGCDLYPSCLHCPLPRCRYDDPGGAPAMLRVGRNAAIVSGYRKGRSVDQLARMFGVSRRTIFRVLRAARQAEAGGARGVA
ncbi:MAG: helix-turn-helix domain-containing protein [Chloroflexota bacterium]|nr:helix-turn-helix domain-containing protein [Dehalococcoidia bacterium]MDW8047530.1 helix-turn-helix domain-containing protein [Chloroflexota bacterium]